MIKSSTRIVTEHDSRGRQMGDRCFYCTSPIGEVHQSECVCFRKRVVVRLTVELVIERPASWTEHDVDFHMNESSSCMSNFIGDLERAYQRDEGPCMCHYAEAKYLRDATQEDLENFRVEGR